MKSQLLAIRTTHHVEESQLDQMLGRHESRTVDYVSFLVSPPCFATNFMRMEKLELASTADEAQGSTSRTVAGGSGLSALGGTQCQKGAGDECRASAPDFSILHRPHIVRQPEECSACGVLTRGKCECGLPVCDAHRYGTDGHHDRFGMCGKCYDEALADDRRNRNECYGSNGRQV